MPRVDIDFSFKKHPLTGDIAIKSGSSAVKQSIRNIVLTDFYERGFNVDMAGNLSASMFENVTVLTLQQIRDNIANALNNYEPNCELIDVVITDEQDNSITVSIYYSIINSSTVEEVSIQLTRIR